MPRPLDGITVLALEHVIAAPYATRQRADLGARIADIAEGMHAYSSVLAALLQRGRITQLASAAGATADAAAARAPRSSSP